MSPGLRRAILYTILGIAVCGFVYSEGRADQRAMEAEQQAQTFLGGHHGYVTHLSSLTAREDTAWWDEQYWEHVADSLGNIKDSSSRSNAARSAALAAPRVDTGVSSVVNGRIIALGHALAACDASRAFADSALVLCKARGDSAEAALALLLKTRTCHIWFVSCPSREAMFITGGILGFLVAKH